MRQVLWRFGWLVVATGSAITLGVGADGSVGAAEGQSPPTTAKSRPPVTTPVTTPITTPFHHPVSSVPVTSPVTAPGVTVAPTSAPSTTVPVTAEPTTVHHARSYAPRSPVSSPPSTTVPPSTTTTTLAPIKGRLPPAPSTVPLVTKAQSAHVDPVLAKISLGGLALAIVIMAVQFVLTRPGRSGRRTL